MAPPRPPGRREGVPGAGGIIAAVGALLLVSPLPGQETPPGEPASGPDPGDSAPLRVLDVPYLPQPEALCGGAAAAMVMRYWGGSAVPEQFAHLVRPEEGGIRPGELAAEVRRLGWRAARVRGELGSVRAHQSEGRPVILLVRVGPDRFHYVTAVAARDGEWLVHDPARAPYRRLSEEDLRRRWEPSGRWGVVVVPVSGSVGAGGSDRGSRRADPGPTEADDPVAARPPAPGAVDPRRPAGGEPAPREEDGRCGRLVTAGVRAARASRPGRADSLLGRAVRLCPGASAPRRELAGLRFRQRRWRASASLAEAALARAPSDEHARRTLAAARLMAGDEEGALAAWNRLGEPRLTGLRVYGLRRTRYRPLRRQVGLSAGEPLSPGDLRAARRRVAAMPAVARSRVGYRAPSGGRTELDVALLERPLLPSFPAGWTGLGARAAAERELRLRVASPTGGDELWTASWSWWEERPHVRVELAVPGGLGAPGVWSVEGLWRRAAFRTAPTGSGSAASPDGATVREEVRRASLSAARWVSGSVRLEATVLLESWSRPGRRAGLGVEAGVRDAGDRVAARASAEGRAGPGAEFWRAGLEAKGRWPGPGSPAAGPVAIRVRAGLEGTGAEAPRMLWPGAGTGHVRRPLLRAHPLLDDGVVTGPAFGRILVHGGVEAGVELPLGLPVSVRAAAFLDVARAWEGATADRALADAGAGLRLALPGTGGRLRVDAARGLVDGADALSVGWEAAWPGW